MKTIEEAAKEFSKETYDTFHQHHRMKGFIAGIEFAQRWIPVEEELPEFGLVVLFKEMNNNARIHLGRICQDTDNFVEMAITYKNVTHWRPIELK